MIILENLTFQTRSDVPNSDWTSGKARYIVDDYSPLAAKIMGAEFGFEPVENEVGELVDAVVLDSVPESGGDDSE